MSLEPLLARIEPDGTIPPVDQWHPEYCGDMDLVIRSDGQWIHEGTPIGRPRLIRLLSTILRREADGDYYLVTPAEKLKICVEDRPFLVVDAQCRDEQGQPVWWLTTNVGDSFPLGSEHQLVVSQTPNDEAIPEVAIRFGLSARFNRNVFYRLVELAEQRQQGTKIALGLFSADHWHPIGYVDAELM